MTEGQKDYKAIIRPKIKLHEDINTTFNNILGYKGIKDTMNLQIRKAKKNRPDTDKVPQFLFWGPPGTGKTALVRAIAKESKNDLIMMDGSDFQGDGLKGGEVQLLEALFHVAYHEQREGHPFIIFIDECDLFLGKKDKNSAADKILAYCESSQRGSSGPLDKFRPWLLLATNFPWTLLPSVMSRVMPLEVSLPPDYETRAQIFLSQIISQFGDDADGENKFKINIIFKDLITLGVMSEDFSGRDIYKACDRAKILYNIDGAPRTLYLETIDGIPFETNEANAFLPPIPEKHIENNIGDNNSTLNKLLQANNVTINDIQKPITVKYFIDAINSPEVRGSVLRPEDKIQYENYRKSTLGK